MSAALITREPSKTVTLAPIRTHSPRTTFPVGARFPHRSAEELAALGHERVAQVSSAPLFPVGARFPRRTAVDAVLYLAELAASGGRVTSTRRSYPIGARFPRR